MWSYNFSPEEAFPHRVMDGGRFHFGSGSEKIARDMVVMLNVWSPPEPALHFVGFRGEEYWAAVKVWGKPDFFHRQYDGRAIAEFMEDDVVIFANAYEFKFTEWAFNDSEVF